MLVQYCMFALSAYRGCTCACSACLLGQAVRTPSILAFAAACALKHEEQAMASPGGSSAAVGSHARMRSLTAQAAGALSAPCSMHISPVPVKSIPHRAVLAKSIRRRCLLLACVQQTLL